MDLFKLNELYILESIPDRECNTAKCLFVDKVEVKLLSLPKEINNL